MPSPSATNPQVLGHRSVRREHERPEREARGEDGVARRLVVERRPGGIDEEEHRRGERRDTPEDERGCAPGDHADREEHAEHDLEQGAPPDRHRQPDDERRQRRPEELHLRERRIAVEELEVVDEVVPRVSALRHRPAERLEPVDGESDDEEDDRCPPRRDERQQTAAEVAHERRLSARRRARAAGPRSSRTRRCSSSSIRSPKVAPRSASPSTLTSPANTAASWSGAHPGRVLRRLRVPVPEPQAAQRVAQPSVDRVRPILEAGRQVRVVDDERRVERVQLAGTVGVVRLGHVAGDALLRVPLERDELRDVLPVGTARATARGSGGSRSGTSLGARRDRRRAPRGCHGRSARRGGRDAPT